MLARTRREVLAGNRTVLEDIGQVTARFVARFHDRPALDLDELDQFLLTLRPERTESGGQALLSRAFLHYYQAKNQIFPETLRELDNPELIAFLQGMGGWDRTPNDLGASQATDWADLSDRMNFIVDLFRSRHLSPNIFEPPFTEAQEAELMAGRIPERPL